MKEQKYIDCIISSKKASFGKVAASEPILKNSSNRISNIPVKNKITFKHFFRFFLVSKVALILALVVFTAPLIAFEAHVVNVTATIERKPCLEYEIRSLGFWKTHNSKWALPQYLGAEIIETQGQAQDVFNLPDQLELNKLKKQLLVLKFNLAFFGGKMDQALVPGESVKISDLVNQADSLLINSSTDAALLELIATRIEKVNTAEKVSTCLTCPKGISMVQNYEFLVNDSSIYKNLSDNIKPGDKLKAIFIIPEGCEGVELSLASYQSSKEAETDSDLVYAYQTGFFDAGQYSMEIEVPECFREVDFVKGSIAEKLKKQEENNLYSEEGRLISRAKGNLDLTCGIETNSLDNSLVEDEKNESLGQAAQILETVESILENESSLEAEESEVVLEEEKVEDKDTSGLGVDLKSEEVSNETSTESEILESNLSKEVLNDTLTEPEILESNLGETIKEEPSEVSESGSALSGELPVSNEVVPNTLPDLVEVAPLP